MNAKTLFRSGRRSGADGGMRTADVSPTLAGPPRVGKGRRARRAAVAFAALSVVVTSACSNGPAETAKPSNGDPEGTARITALAAELQERPTSIGITEPVSQPIPAGKRIAFVTCGVPVCVLYGETVEKAAAHLGWSVYMVNTKGTPASIQAAFNQVVQDKPDAVFASGIEPRMVATQLAKLHDADIPALFYSVASSVPGTSFVFGDPEALGREMTTPMAAYIVADSGGSANTLYVNLPAYEVLKGELDGFKKTYAEGCSGCGFTQLDLPLEALGKDVPQRIVSALRADPSIDYVAMPVDDLTSGLPAALKAAGLADKVKIVGAACSSINFTYIQTGQEAACVPNAIYELSYLWVDALARIFVGDSTDPDKVDQPRWLITKENLPTTDAPFPFVEDYEEQFLALWGK